MSLLCKQKQTVSTKDLALCREEQESLSFEEPAKNISSSVIMLGRNERLGEKWYKIQDKLRPDLI